MSVECFTFISDCETWIWAFERKSNEELESCKKRCSVISVFSSKSIPSHFVPKAWKRKEVEKHELRFEQASQGEACIQAWFTFWNLVLEDFLRGLITVLECFALERHLYLRERRSHDYRVTGLQDNWGCSKL